MTRIIAFVLCCLLVGGVGSAAKADQVSDFLKAQHEALQKEARGAPSNARRTRLDRREFQLTRAAKGIEAAQKQARDRAQQAADAAQKALETGTLGRPVRR